MTIRVYSSLDTGAPVLAGARLLDNLRTVLLAALVNGYGGKPGAGWTVAHNVADGFSLSNGEGVISIVHSNSQAVAVYIMEAVTDPSTALPGGINRRSGRWFDGQSIADRQFIYMPPFIASSTNKGWVCVADDSTATLLFQGGDTAVDRNVASGQALHFGRFFPVLGGVGFCALGGAATAYGSGRIFSGGAVGSVLRNCFTGLVDQGMGGNVFAVVPSDSSVLNVRAKARLSVRAMRLSRVSLSAQGVGHSGSSADPAIAGILRGMVYDPSLGEAFLSQVLPVLGVAGATNADRLRPHEVGGKTLVPVYPNTSDLGAFVSLDAADWGPLWTV